MEDPLYDAFSIFLFRWINLEKILPRGVRDHSVWPNIHHE